MTNKIAQRKTKSVSEARRAEVGDVARTVIFELSRARRADPSLFPGGITRIRLSSRDFEFEVEGPPIHEVEVARIGRVARISDAAHTIPPEPVEEAAQVPQALDLGVSAAAAAKALLDQFPNDVVFTSGRRTLAQQASAMAGNVVKNRKYIEETYKDSPQRDALQKWVDENSGATNAPQIAKGLESVMKGWTESQQRSFSRHLTGDAFDVNPVPGEVGKKIQEAMQKLPKLNWITFNEAGLAIWHAQFDA